MSESFGQLEALRIRKAQENEAKKVEWQITKRELIRSQAPLFFDKVGEILSQSASDFNDALELTGDSAMSFRQHDHVIEIGKSGGHTAIIRKIVYHAADGVVKVRTQIIKGLQDQSRDEALVFDVNSDGQIILGGVDFATFTQRMFKTIADAYGPA